MKLDAKRIHEILLDCLFREDELSEDGRPLKEAILIQGVTMNVGLCQERVQAYKTEIAEACSELTSKPYDVLSFLDMCEDKHGNLWGEHPNVQELVFLGCAVGVLKMRWPRELWQTLPGGMPLFEIRL